MASKSTVNPFAREAVPRGLWRWIPGVLVLRDYKREWLIKDVTAGLVLTAILVPVGMGYAEAAGIPAIYGLYATIVPLLAYAVFGPSRILVLGPDSSLAALIAATVLPLSGGDTGHAVTLAGMLAILSGLMCILAGIAKFGFITDLLSKPIRYGYLNGIALTVLIGQLPKIVGFPAKGDNLIQEALNLARGIFAGQVNLTACILGVVCLAIILGFKRWQPKIPGVLVAVVGATLAAAVFDLANRTGISVVGPLPRGLPVPTIPTVSFEEFRTLFASAIAIALVSFADMSVLSRTFALRCGYEVDGDQELIALGISNVAAGFFQGFSVSSSASRTPVAEAAGSKTQLTGVVGAVCIALLLLVAPTLLQTLPHAALGAIVISACLGLFEIPGLLRLYHLRRGEFVLSLVCFLGVALLGVIQGIFLAVGLALLAFVWRAWRPYHAVLGMVDELQSYHDIVRHPEGRLIPGLVLFRWNAPLFFANAEIFHEHVLQAVAEAPTPTKWVVVTAEPVTDVDLTAADVLSELDQALHKEGIELCFAEMKGPVKDHLKKYGLFTRLGVENFYPTIEQAVAQYLKVHPVEVKRESPPDEAH
ncbi:MAG: SulP family inorganic anion transporter [Anaerolineae bacterium]|nr:SulP family inorganic anion transporter [Anaerolineae bacterium]